MTDRIDSPAVSTGPQLCFYVPGELSIIDVIRADGRSFHYGQTLEEIRQRYAGAIIGPLDDWCAQKAQTQDGPIAWNEITEERYTELMECLPPAAYGRGGFLVGEPWDHHALTGQPRYQACFKRGDVCFASSRALTRDEFRTVALPLST